MPTYQNPVRVVAVDTQALVGRRFELDLLERTLESNAGQRLRCLAITGEPGIGKTRLLAELSAGADRRKQLVLEGRAAEFEREYPFGLVVDALDDYLASLPQGLLRDLGGERLSELAAVLPAVGPLAPSRLASAEVERYRAYRAVRTLLSKLARERPLVLALDDVHWADAASLELISYLLRRPPGASVLLALAFRPAQAEPSLTSALARAQRERAVEELELGPLTQADAEQLLAPLDAETRAEIYRESGGNPFYLEALARAASRRRRGPWSPRRGRGLGRAGAGKRRGNPACALARLRRSRSSRGPARSR